MYRVATNPRKQKVGKSGGILETTSRSEQKRGTNCIHIQLNFALSYQKNKAEYKNYIDGTNFASPKQKFDMIYSLTKDMGRTTAPSVHVNFTSIARSQSLREIRGNWSSDEFLLPVKKKSVSSNQHTAEGADGYDWSTNVYSYRDIFSQSLPRLPLSSLYVVSSLSFSVFERAKNKTQEFQGKVCK